MECSIQADGDARPRFIRGKSCDRYQSTVLPVVGISVFATNIDVSTKTM